MGIFGEIVVLICAAAAVVFLCRLARIPSGVGFLITGVLAGPHALAIVHDPHDIELLAEIGVILLLFTIGLEFSVKKLASIKRLALGGGSLQMGLTIMAFGLLVLLLDPGRSLMGDLFIGMLAALSSTAVVLKLLKDRGEVDLPHGNASLGILIFQDIAVVPLMLLVPVMAGTGADSAGHALLVLLGKAALLVGLVLVLTQRVVPFFLSRVARMRDRELFLLAVASICLGVAYLTWELGMSLALGAFLAGLIIAESDYSHQAVAVVMPFHDLFMSFFFISMGMLLDLTFVSGHMPQILLAALLLAAVKAVVASGAAVSVGLTLPAGLLTGLALFQVGEFSFILAREGLSAGLLGMEDYQTFLAAAIVTMIATPFVIANGARLTKRLSRMQLPALVVGRSLAEPPEQESELTNHLVIIGFGIGGRHLAQAAKLWCLPYVVVEGNPDTVRAERAKGEPIFFGDATSEHILEHAAVSRARAVAVTINDPAACRRIVHQVRDAAPKALLIARTPYLGDVPELRRLGANEVVAAEYEASAEVLARVLSSFLVPDEEIAGFIRELREQGYEMLREMPVARSGLCEFGLPNVRVTRLRVAEEAPAVGRSLADLALRKEHRVSVLALRRETEVLHPPPANMPFAVDDVVLLAGEPDGIATARGIFEGQAPGATK